MPARQSTGSVCAGRCGVRWPGSRFSRLGGGSGRGGTYGGARCFRLSAMTGLTTMSQPLMVVENRAFGNRAYCTINEGLGKVMRFGGNDADVLSRLAWLRDVLGPVLGDALRDMRGVPLKNLVARGLGMGDEMHQRNVACTGLLLRALAPALARRCNDSETLAQALTFIAGNEPVLPQYRDGARQGDDGSGARYRSEHRGDRHVPQRYRFWHPSEWHRR